MTDIKLYFQGKTGPTGYIDRRRVGERSLNGRGNGYVHNVLIKQVK